MLKEVFAKLDHEIAAFNRNCRQEGSAEIPHFFIKVLGQTALIEAKVELTLFATMDVDAYANFQWAAREKFSQVLREYDLVYDGLSQEIWMPKETEYTLVYYSADFDGMVALPEYVLLSKALKAKVKNKNLISEYLGLGASTLFLELCIKYKVDLGYFVDE